MCEDRSSKEQGEKGRGVCFFFLRYSCRKGRWCRFSHRRPPCRYGENCNYGPTRCRYSHHGSTPKVRSVMVGGTTKKQGRHHARNRRRREKLKVLKAEAKVSLVKMKELETQLEEEQK
ncbi:unnamed protein product, partial [Heterosigma akashiwo]